MTTVRELADTNGIDLVLDELGVFAMECANIEGQAPECKKVFETIAQEIADCNKKVYRLIMEGMQYIERAQVVANITDFSLNEVLESELEAGSKVQIGDNLMEAGAYTYELSDAEVYRVLNKQEAYREGIDLFGENMSQQTNEFWVLTIK